MVTKLFDPEEFNAAFKNLKIFSDGQGEDKLTSEGFASMNFDGLIPIEVDNFPAASIVPGMHISLTGSSDGVTFYQVTSVTESDSDLTASPTQISYIEYLDDNEEVNILETSSSNVYSIFYENWDDKYLGTTGWYISSEGNAIFSNVAIRGRVEATEGTLQNIIAESGNIEKLSIGAGKTYDFINIVGTASVTDANHSGQFILTMADDYTQRKLSPGDYFYVNSTSAVAGLAFIDGIPSTASPIFNTITIDKDGFWSSPYTFKVLTASYNPAVSNRYFCEVSQTGSFPLNYDFSQVTASFGQLNVGYLYFGEFSVFNPTGGLQIDGLILSTIGEESFTQGYIPDYIDLSGKFRLGKGKLTFDGETLTVDANLTVGDLSASYALLTALSTSGSTVINGSNISTGNIDANLIQSGSITSAFISGNTIKGGTISGQTISGGTISGAFINGGYGSFSGAVTATSGRIGSTSYGWNIGSGYMYGSGISLATGLDAGNGGIYFSSGGADITAPGIFYDSTNSALAIQGSFSTDASRNIRIYAGTGSTGLGTVYINGSVINLNSTTSVNGTLSATNISGNGSGVTNINPANISSGTAGISVTGNASTSTSAGGLFGSPSISVNGITNNANGITNTSGQITSLPTYNNANSSLVANQHINASGVFRRVGSTQRIKTKITPLNQTVLSNYVDVEKIFNGEPEFNYKSILSITPVEYTPIEDGEERGDIRSIGFIAEDIADKTPNIATYDLEGIPEYYNINSIVASMLAVLQDQQKTIEDLQNRVLQLESEIGG